MERGVELRWERGLTLPFAQSVVPRPARSVAAGPKRPPPERPRRSGAGAPGRDIDRCSTLTSPPADFPPLLKSTAARATGGLKAPHRPL